MIRRTTQRPTGKTAVPRHPFFIGSRPEPVFCGGIYLSFFGYPPNCDPGVLTSENILSKWVGKSTFGDFWALQGGRKSQDPGGRLGLFASRRKNIAARAAEPRSRPAPLLRGFRVPEAETARGGEPAREAAAWGGCGLGRRRVPLGPAGPSPPPAAGARGRGTARLCPGVGCGGGVRVLPPAPAAAGLDRKEPPGPSLSA